MAWPNIQVENRHKRYRLNKRLTVKVVKKILKEVGRRKTFALEVQFVGDPEIRKLNRRFKKLGRATDILSFDLDGSGSIAISLDTVLRNSKKFAVPFYEESVRCVIHGILHLFGYDDFRVKDRVRMWERQDRILRHLKREEDLSRVLTRR